LSGIKIKHTNTKEKETKIKFTITPETQLGELSFEKKLLVDDEKPSEIKLICNTEGVREREREKEREREREREKERKREKEE